MLTSVALLALTLLSDGVTLDYRDAPRPRFAVGHWGGYGKLGGVTGAGAGISVELGAQFGDTVAAYAMAWGGTAVVEMIAGAAMMFEYTFAHVFSVGAGLGVAATYDQPDGLSLWGPGRPSETAVALGMPVRVAFNFGALVEEDPQRHRFFLAFDAFVGAPLMSPPGGGVGGSAGFSLGYRLM